MFNKKDFGKDDGDDEDDEHDEALLYSTVVLCLGFAVFASPAKPSEVHNDIFMYVYSTFCYIIVFSASGEAIRGTQRYFTRYNLRDLLTRYTYAI